MTSEHLQLAISTARQAGREILRHYRRSAKLEAKADGSPLTMADLASHRLIVAMLGASGIPIVSEEGSNLHLEVERYWLVDPLDGTKDFLASNDEFTVNIALVENSRPVLGVVLAPALGELFAGGPALGSWKEKDDLRSECHPLGKSSSCRMAVSRFHDHPDVELFASANRIGERLAMGSALKYGRLASAEVDVFPRLVGSSEWDTAAGQAVLEGAGGQVLDWETGQPLRYGKPRRRNPRLLSIRAPYSYAEFTLQKYATSIP